MANQRRIGVTLGYTNIIVKNLVNLLYTPMLLAFVGQGDFGVFQTANSFIFTLTLLSFGFAGAYVRFYTQRSTKGDEQGIRTLNGMYFLLYMIICVAAVVIGFLFSANAETIFASSFSGEEIGLAKTLMIIMSFNIAITLFSAVFDANIIVHEKFAFQQSRQIIMNLATPLLALGLLFCGFETVGVACAQLTVSICLLAVNARFAIVKLGMRFDFKHFESGLLRALAVFSAWLFMNQICDLINQNVPNVVLGAECGAIVVSVFAVSIQIRNVFVSLSSTISNVFVPEINRIVADTNDNKTLEAIMTKVGRYQMILLCWVYGGFILLGRFFILKWAGEGFSDAYLMILAMVLPLLVPLTQNVGIEIQKAKNMHKARSIVYLCMAVISVAFTALVAPQLGYWAAAIGYIFSIVLGNCLFMNWYYHKKVGLNMFRFWKAILPIVLCAAIVTTANFIGTSWLPVADWTSFFVWGIVFTLSYALGIWFFILKETDRKSIFKHLLRQSKGESLDTNN